MKGAFANVYAGRPVLLTGHTGFKGSWLALWLHALGARLSGLSLPPDSEPNHWSMLGVPIEQHLGDIRDAAWLREAVQTARPEIVFHLAAQSLVRRSYRSPLDTWSSNVMGTANLLDACRDLPDLKAIVVITTDKVYDNREWCWGYREIDPLGGHDPYSASKAACELVVASYRKSFLADRGVLLASVRAGNVIGGGDWCEDRLIPDLVRALTAGEPLRIRSPQSTRPWQHVLECLGGYLQVGQRLLAGETRFADSFNFGPDPGDNRTVSDIVSRLCIYWPAFAWTQDQQSQPHEANLLYLDNAKAKAALGWRPVWNLDQTLGATAHWYRNWLERKVVSSREQLDAYVGDARTAGLSWSGA